ncbi:MAG: AAA family ATPase [Promethearchaeota archaeon]|nr:MAG: AAA family ATPase [Candidatus Lokiarchaeota archaeon]
MGTNYLEDLLRKPTLFKAENTLNIDFIPEKLPHREKELSLLSQLFLSLITNPNTISRRVLITGGIGIGKTATVKLFGEMLKKVAKKRRVHIKYIHINCRKERSPYKVLIKIIEKLQKNFPKRGYSSQDLLEIISKTIESKNLHILLVLDELNYLISKDNHIIYSLTRIYDDTYNQAQRISLIGIVRDISCLNNLDSSTLSTLQRNIIKFKNYSIKQIYEIMEYRAHLSLKKDIISNDLIQMLSEIVYEKGDIRYGLNLLWKACKIAERKNLKYITPEILRLANKNLIPYSLQDFLSYLNVHKILFLLSIIMALNNSRKESTSLSKIFERYKIVCENLQEDSRSESQLRNYLNEFEREGIISVNIISKNIQGRKSMIKILDFPLEYLEEMVIRILQEKGYNI